MTAQNLSPVRLFVGFATLFLLIITAGGLSACALPSAAEFDAPQTLDTQAPYILNPGDTITVNVFGEETLTGNYLIDSRGIITIPMLGEVSAAGWSVKELKDHLTKRFEEEKYLRAPLITVDAATLRPIAIMGEVKTPGSYPFKPLQTVFQTIATAGGYTPRAAENKVLIDRWVEGRLVRLNATEDTPVLPGDSLRVRERIF